VDAGVDDLLAVAARRLRGAVRSPDTVARVGDRQFAVLLERADRQMAEDVGRRISDTLRNPIPVGGRRCVLSVDIGVWPVATRHGGHVAEVDG
jgi:GGDEF domain-containing protein